MTPPAMPRDAGITLVEMLVALAIFALVGLASFTTLDTILRVRDRTDGRLEQLAQLDRALVVFSRDLQQADPAGLTLQGGVLRADDPNDQAYRSYLMQDGGLIRETGERFDDTPLRQTLYGPITALTFRVLSGGGAWSDVWPDDSGLAPKGVEMTATLDRDRSLTRLVVLTQPVLP